MNTVMKTAQMEVNDISALNRALGQAALSENVDLDQLVQLSRANFTLHRVRMELEEARRENKELKNQLELMKLTSRLQTDVAKMREDEEAGQERADMVAVLKALMGPGKKSQVKEETAGKETADLLKKLFPQ